MTLTVSAVHLGCIIIPKDNPRQDFDEGKLRGLAKSIQSVGLLEPILLRPVDEAGEVFELVAGERRFRAVQILEWQEIPAIVREMTDTESAEARLLENLDRESLNPMEEAAAFQQLEDLGHSSKSLAALIRRTKDSIENRMLLLELPAWWQDRIRRGELSAAAAEYLLPWADCIDILDEMKTHARAWPMLLTDWNACLVRVVKMFSWSMEPGEPDGPRFKHSKEQKASLDIRPLRIDSRTTVRRALNGYMWRELQDLADRDAPVVMTQAAEADGPEAGEAHEPAKVMNLSPAPPRTDGEGLADWFPAWLRKILISHVQRMPENDLRLLFRRLGIDPRAHWRMERDFLELYTGEGLEALAAELEVDTSEARNRQEVMAVFLHAKPERIPSAVDALMG